MYSVNALLYMAKKICNINGFFLEEIGIETVLAGSGGKVEPEGRN
jgi:hypothetical protein